MTRMGTGCEDVAGVGVDGIVFPARRDRPERFDRAAMVGREGDATSTRGDFFRRGLGDGS